MPTEEEQEIIKKRQTSNENTARHELYRNAKKFLYIDLDESKIKKIMDDYYIHEEWQLICRNKDLIKAGMFSYTPQFKDPTGQRDYLLVNQLLDMILK